MRFEILKSEQIGIPLKKTKQATIYKGGKEIRLLLEGENEWKLTRGRKKAFEKIEGGEVVRVRNRNKA